jgi:hypothetical protein
MTGEMIHLHAQDIKRGAYGLELYMAQGGFSTLGSMSIADLQEAERVLRQLAADVAEARCKLLANARRAAA